MTQEELILSHMQNKGAITPLEALDKYGCFRLASIVFNLKEKGHNIVTTMKEAGGKRFASYSFMYSHNISKGRCRGKLTTTAKVIRDLFGREPYEVQP